MGRKSKVAEAGPLSLCLVRTCDRQRYTAGLCMMHYSAQRRLLKRAKEQGDVTVDLSSLAVPRPPVLRGGVQLNTRVSAKTMAKLQRWIAAGRAPSAFLLLRSILDEWEPPKD